MARQRIKVYEEKRGLAIWYWLIPGVFLLAGLLAFVFIRSRPKLARPHPTAARQSSLPELGSLQFEPGKANLSPDGLATLARALEAMRGNPNVRLRLEGYPAAAPKGKREDLLLEQRLQTVVRALDNAGIEKSRITGGSFGKPSAADLAARVKSDYRRVELYVR